MAAAAPSWTLSQLRVRAQQESYLTNDPNVTTPQWNSFLTSEATDLYGRLVMAYANTYFCTYPYPTFQSDGVNDHFALPTDCFKLLGCDVSLGNDPNGWWTVPQFMDGERNRFSVPYVPTLGRLWDLAHRLEAGYIKFNRVPESGLTFRLLYVPLPVLPVESAPITLLSVGPGDTFSVTTNTGYSPLTLTAVTGSPATNQFQIGATQAATATNLASAISSTTSEWVANRLSASAALNIVTLSLTTTAATIPQIVTWSTTPASGVADWLLAPSASWSNILSGTFNGWEEAIVIGAGIRARDSLDLDLGRLPDRLAVFNDRIDKEAENRNIGAPQTVTDARSQGGYNGYGFGYNGDVGA